MFMLNSFLTFLSYLLLASFTSYLLSKYKDVIYVSAVEYVSPCLTVTLLGLYPVLLCTSIVHARTGVMQFST